MPFDAQTYPELEIAPVMDDVLRALIEGRARINAGWCKKAIHRATPDGPQFCALGAVYCTDTGDMVRGDRGDRPAAVYLLRALDQKWGDDIVHFNNHPATTHADVLSLFDRAIAARKAG